MHDILREHIGTITDLWKITTSRGHGQRTWQFSKSSRKNAKELEPRKPDLSVPVLLESSLVGIPYKDRYKSLKAKKSLHIGPIAWVEEFHVGRRLVTRCRMHRFFGLGRGCGRRRAMIFSRPEPPLWLIRHGITYFFDRSHALYLHHKGRLTT